MSYLQLPVVLRFDVPLSERFDIYFGGGPYGALQLAESTETDIEETGQEPIDSESFERFDYGALGEAGVEVPFESYALQLSVRYGFGIADLLQEEVRRVEGDINNTINTRALFFTAGFRF